jgi:hypothetical protein
VSRFGKLTQIFMVLSLLGSCGKKAPNVSPKPGQEIGGGNTQLVMDEKGNYVLETMIALEASPEDFVDRADLAKRNIDADENSNSTINKNSNSTINDSTSPARSARIFESEDVMILALQGSWLDDHASELRRYQHNGGLSYVPYFVYADPADSQFNLYNEGFVVQYLWGPSSTLVRASDGLVLYGGGMAEVFNGSSVDLDMSTVRINLDKNEISIASHHAPSYRLIFTFLNPRTVRVTESEPFSTDRYIQRIGAAPAHYEAIDWSHQLPQKRLFGLNDYSYQTLVDHFGRDNVKYMRATYRLETHWELEDRLADEQADGFVASIYLFDTNEFNHEYDPRINDWRSTKIKDESYPRTFTKVEALGYDEHYNVYDRQGNFMMNPRLIRSNPHTNLPLDPNIDLESLGYD